MCDSGIEGVYLDGEGGMKFHERCLRCADCGVGLRGGYFKVGEGVYCERDAWRRRGEEMGRGRGGGNANGRGRGRGAALGVGPGRSPMGRMEKRTTRLMMMG